MMREPGTRFRATRQTPCLTLLEVYCSRMRKFKVIVEKHPDGYVAYPIGLKGVVVGEGDTYEEALADVQSAIRFHIETFGEEVR